jgi:hypothetical protein
MLGSAVNCILSFGSIEKKISMIDSNKVKNASKFQNNMVTITLTSRALF